jgi:hypothetical protein
MRELSADHCPRLPFLTAQTTRITSASLLQLSTISIPTSIQPVIRRAKCTPPTPAAKPGPPPYWWANASTHTAPRVRLLARKLASEQPGKRGASTSCGDHLQRPARVALRAPVSTPTTRSRSCLAPSAPRLRQHLVMELANECSAVSVDPPTASLRSTPDPSLVSPASGAAGASRSISRLQPQR